MKTPTYSSWSSMKDRCNQPSHKDYKNYGGRGITYDPRWGIFELFYEDMGERPAGYTLERDDVNGNYCKDNCRWATWREQATNRRPRTTHPDNKTGVLGVRYVLGKYQAYYKNLYIGRYDTIIDAVAARLRQSNNYDER